MSEKEQEMTSKKLGLHVGDSFQDTREIREVLDKSVFREEEPTHSQQAEVLEEPVAMEASEEISDAKPEAIAEPTQELEQEAEQPLSRMSRRSRKAGVEATKAEASKVEENTEELEADVAVEPIRRQAKRPVPIAIPFVLSLLISLLHVGVPFLTRFATNQQSQNLYAGWAMTKGQVPFGDFYGTNGLLYYAINWLGSLAGGHWILMILQAIALFFAGTYLYRVVRLLVSDKDTAKNVQLLFYFLVLGLGFGGTYVTLFSLPILFASMNFILAYLIGHRKDEGFILYGAIAAVAFLIDPMTSALFYLLAFLGLTAFNIKQKRWARGFYQLLAALLGFSLVFYPIGYITVLNQTFGYAINQVTYVFNALNFSNGQTFSNAIYYGLLALAFGLVSAFLMSFTKQNSSARRIFRFMGWAGSLVVLIVSIGLPEQGAYQLLPMLPFVLPLFAIWFSRDGEENDGIERRGRKKKNKEVWAAYFTSQVFLPLVALVYLLANPVVQDVVLQSG
ncbi:MAG: MFS transporter, partial [Streptococcus sp.]|nr:MFS transporter [Streptococcus sp.]